MTEPDPRRLVHFTPLRHPGGKGKLATYVKKIIEANKLYDGEYVEPYAAALQLGSSFSFRSTLKKSTSTI